MNLPLRPWLPGPWAQPQAHTESGGPWRSTALGEREEKGKEREIIWRQKVYSFSPLAFFTVGAHAPLFILKH